MDFNILKELYIDRTNKDILNSMLEYIDRHTRTMIVKSYSSGYYTFKEHICENCYKESYCTKLGCISFLFCKDCTRKHYETYTSPGKCASRMTYTGKVETRVFFRHCCEFEEGYIVRTLFFDELTGLPVAGESSGPNDTPEFLNACPTNNPPIPNDPCEFLNSCPRVKSLRGYEF